MSSIIRATTTSGLQIAPDNSGSLQLQTNGTTAAVTVDTSQNTTFAGKVTSAGALTLASNGTTTAVTIDTSQNVGIGATSPGQKLDISTSGDIQARIGNSVTGAQFTYDIGRVAASGLLQFYGNQSGATGYIFSGINGERMRIDSSGRLLLGTSTVGGGLGGSPVITAQGASGQDAAIIRTTSASAGNLVLGLWNDSNTGDNTLVYFYANSTVAVKGGVDYNRTGNVIRYNTSSDATLKNIIGDADGVKSIEILNSTRIRDYSWKDDATNKPQIGVIAQELYETFKGAVAVGGDVEKTDAEGNITTEYRPWAVDKTAFTFHLVKGWQEHNRIIKEQQTIINDLKARVETLEAK